MPAIKHKQKRLAMNKQTAIKYEVYDDLFKRVQRSRKLRSLESNSIVNLREFDEIVARFFNREFYLQNDLITTVQRETESKLRRKYERICSQLEKDSIDSSVSSEDFLQVKIHQEKNDCCTQRPAIKRRRSGVDAQTKSDIQELYADLIRLRQLIQLNMSSFDRILREHDRVFDSDLGRKFHERWSHQRSDELYDRLDKIELLIQNVQSIYSSHLMSNDHKKARRELLKISPSDLNSNRFDLRIGFELGCLVVLLVLLVLVVNCYANEYHDWPRTIRLFRFSLVLSLFLLQAGVSLIIWRHYNISCGHIFRLADDQIRLPHQNLIEFSLLIGVFWCLSLIVWVMNSPDWYFLRSTCPLAIVLVVFAYLINPTAGCHSRERFWLIKVLVRIFTAPLHLVRFSDYWLADQFVSMVPLFLDLEYVVCHYATNDDPLSDSCVSRNYPHLLIRSIVAVAPAWFRVCQCIRISRDKNWRPHQLFNALKYGSMIFVITLANTADIGNINKPLSGAIMITWLVSSAIVSCIAASWDMIYDFGVFESWFALGEIKQQYGSSCNGGENKKRWPLLRRHLTFPAWFYYFAIIEDWMLKFGWLIFIVLTRMLSIEVEFALTITTISDLFSKFIWNIIKVENEWRLKVARQEALQPRFYDLSFAISAPLK